MKFLSPVSDVFIQGKEFNSIIKQAKDCQLDYSLKKIREFTFLDDEVVSEIFPQNTPEVLLDKRRHIKFL